MLTQYFYDVKNIKRSASENRETKKKKKGWTERKIGKKMNQKKKLIRVNDRSSIASFRP
jgi:hypothetical protein